MPRGNERKEGFERFIPWSTAWPSFDDSFVLSPIFTDSSLRCERQAFAWCEYDTAFLAYCGIKAA